MMADRKKANIRFGLVFAGLVFFMNPTIQLFDILPDVIGAFLIYLGLKKPALADGYFEDARKLSFYLIWMYVIKTVLSFSLVSNSENALPFSFLSGVVEILFVCTFFHKLYLGFEYTSMRTEKKAAVHNTNSAYIMSIVFTVAKCVLTFLPEMLEFLKQNEEIDLSANSAYKMSIIVLKPYAIALAVFIQFILGIIFIVYTAKFFGEIKRDGIYLGELAEKYESELVLNRQKNVCSALGSSCTFFAFALLFMADIHIEGMDIFPDILSAVCLTFAFVCISRINPVVRFPKVLCTATLIFGTIYTAISSYVRPEMFELLSGERSVFENHSENFWIYGKNSAFYSVIAGLFAVIWFVAVIRLIIYYQRVYKYENMGNCDRKLLTLLWLTGLTALFKAGCVFFDSSIAHLATNPEVEKFISARTRMIPEKMAEQIASNHRIALFSSTEKFGTVFLYASIMFAVFAAINIFSLKLQFAEEEK